MLRATDGTRAPPDQMREVGEVFDVDPGSSTARSCARRSTNPSPTGTREDPGRGRHQAAIPSEVDEPAAAGAGEFSPRAAAVTAGVVTFGAWRGSTCAEGSFSPAALIEIW
ncbi:hypothetical protein GCM10027174_07960 [Salinifilum aidingensis]